MESGGVSKFSGMLRRPAVLATVPVLVLVTMAAAQFVLVTRHGLSAWKGGGFGMFSTIDSPSNRFLRCFLVRPSATGTSTQAERTRVRPPEETRYKELLELARAIPTDEHLRRVAFALRKESWVELESPAWIPDNSADPEPGSDGAEAAPRGEFTFQQQVISVPQSGKAPPHAKKAKFVGVAVEVWRYRWDWRALKVSAVRMNAYEMNLDQTAKVKS